MNRPHVTVIMGGQWGSEGKGCICGYLGNQFDVAIRVGGPNAGHTLKVGKNTWKFRQIPVAGLVNPDIILCIGAAGLINMDVLKEECAQVPHCRERLFIDRNAGILTEHHIQQEENEDMNKKIGSTCEGVGAALRHKIKRDGNFRTAKDVTLLKKYATIINVAEYLNNGNKRIMIEGTQGSALSLDHGPYPFCTSRNVLASSLLSDVGLSPMVCDEIIMVVRTYPIRVAGNSGPMAGKELTWEEVTKRSKAPHPISEQTTVTKRTRRVCGFDFEPVREAVLMNRPTQLALTFVDYLDYANHGVTEYNKLTKKSREWVEKLEELAGVPVTLIKTGIDITHIIDRQAEYKIQKEEPSVRW
jgi:adenylosuccinate synthase